jgi:transcriptional regulator with XRE-family HTH domain
VAKKAAKSKLKKVGNASRQVREFNRKIGAKVRELAKARGATTITLAKAIGVSQAQISRLENGLQGFRSATLLKIAIALGVKPQDLLP